MIKKIDHLAIAVPSIQDVAPLYAAILGTPLEGEEEVPDQGVRVGFFRVGESNIELLEPLARDTKVGKFLEQRGPGLHHVSLEVEGLEKMLEELSALGVRLIDKKPRQGADNRRIAFIHPSSTGGVLVELSEKEGL